MSQGTHAIHSALQTCYKITGYDQVMIFRSIVASVWIDHCTFTEKGPQKVTTNAVGISDAQITLMIQ